MNKLQHTRMEFQKIIDEAMQIAGSIRLLQRQIESYENILMGQGWSQGNIKFGWSRGDLFSNKLSIYLKNRDRIFSLSSFTSPASSNIPPLENQRTSPNDSSRFYKKKKNILKTSTRRISQKNRSNKSKNTKAKFSHR